MIGTVSKTAPASTPVAAAAPRRTPAPSAGRTTPRRRPFPIVTFSFLSLAWLGLVAAGAPYYELDLAERLRHPWHPLLKPNGTVGLAYGYVGTFLLLLLLAYTLRKRWRPLARLGTLRKWLAVHITCGLLGPAFITLHAGFKFHGAIAIGYWAMICVMLSGFVGFYIYSQMPRAIAGQADATQALRTEIEALDRELVERFGFQPEEITALRRAAGIERAAALGPLASLGFLILQDVRAALGIGRGPLGHKRRARHEMRRLHGLVRRRMLAERRLGFLRQTEVLFGYWHAIHKPFAIILYTMLGLHIGVAVWLGYAWAW